MLDLFSYFRKPKTNSDEPPIARPTRTARIFVSYRRGDSAGIAGRIFDRLIFKYGTGNVFMDIDAIPVGSDFAKS